MNFIQQAFDPKLGSYNLDGDTVYRFDEAKLPNPKTNEYAIWFNGKTMNYTLQQIKDGLKEVEEKEQEFNGYKLSEIIRLNNQAPDAKEQAKELSEKYSEEPHTKEKLKEYKEIFTPKEKRKRGRKPLN